RCYSPACHRHPASLLVRVPAAKSSLPVLSACALRPRPNLPLRLASSPPSSSFHPDSSQHLPSTRVRRLAAAFGKREQAPALQSGRRGILRFSILSWGVFGSIWPCGRPTPPL